MTIAKDTNSLEHYGVKGQKWGVTRASQTGGASGSGKAPKLSRKEKNAEILNARKRQSERAFQLERQAFKAYSANGDKQVEKSLAKYAKMETDLLTNPDAKTAARLTSGEKAVTGAAWTFVAISAVGIIAGKLK